MEHVADGWFEPGVMKSGGGDQYLVAVALDVSAVTALAGDAVHGRLISLT